MSQIAIEVLGQKSIRTDYDYMVTIEDLLSRLSDIHTFLANKGEAISTKSDDLPFLEEGVISAPQIATAYRVMGCLIDNTVFPSWPSETHEIIIAGGPKVVYELKQHINRTIPRMFPCMPSDQKDHGSYDKSYIFEVGHGFDLNSFQSAAQALLSLSGTQRR